MRLEQIYLETKLKDIPKENFRKLLGEALFELFEDHGQSVDGEKAKRIKEKVEYILLEKYRKWRWFEVKRTLQRGTEGEFIKVHGAYKEITMKILYAWFGYVEKEKQSVRMEEVHKREADERRNRKPVPPEIAAKIAQVIREDIRNSAAADALGKKRRQDDPIPISNYRYSVVKQILNESGNNKSS